jgi:hypothetical protein
MKIKNDTNYFLHKITIPLVLAVIAFAWLAMATPTFAQSADWRDYQIEVSTEEAMVGDEVIVTWRVADNNNISISNDFIGLYELGEDFVQNYLIREFVTDNFGELTFVLPEAGSYEFRYISEGRDYLVGSRVIEVVEADNIAEEQNRNESLVEYLLDRPTFLDELEDEPDPSIVPPREAVGSAPTPRTEVASRFDFGERVASVNRLNVRDSYGLSGARLGSQQTGSAGTVLDITPQLANDYIWIAVDFDNGPDGWVAEEFLVPSVIMSAPAPRQTTTDRDRQVLQAQIDSLMAQIIQLQALLEQLNNQSSRSDCDPGEACTWPGNATR